MRRVCGWRSVLIGALSMLMFNALIWYLLGRAVFPGNGLINSCVWLREVVFYSYWFIGIAQFLYVVPICFWLIDRRRFASIKGGLVGVLLTVVLNGLLLASFPPHIGIG